MARTKQTYRIPASNRLRVSDETRGDYLHFRAVRKFTPMSAMLAALRPRYPELTDEELTKAAQRIFENPLPEGHQDI